VNAVVQSLLANIEENLLAFIESVSRSEAKFTDGICPDRMRKLYPQY